MKVASALEGLRYYLNPSTAGMVANLANTKLYQKPENWQKPWHMGSHLGVLSKGFPMNTNMTEFR